MTRVILFCLVASFSITCFCCISLHNENQIKAWADENGYTVIEINRVFNPVEGPFWRYRGDDLLRVKLQKDGIEKISYFHFNICGIEQAWAASPL